MTRLEIMCLEEKDHRGKGLFFSRLNQGTYLPWLKCPLITAEALRVRFLYYIIYNIMRRGVTLCKGWEVMPHLLEEYVHMLLPWRFVRAPSRLYFSPTLHQYRLMGITYCGL